MRPIKDLQPTLIRANHELVENLRQLSTSHLKVLKKLAFLSNFEKIDKIS